MWLPLAGGLGVLAGCALLAVVLWGCDRQTVTPPHANPGDEREQGSPAALNPHLIVRVFNNVDKPWLPIDQPGALPARPGELVRAEVGLDRPAYSYLLLLTSQGEVVPLYPWNEGPDLNVLDANAPPPVRREQNWANPRRANTGWELDRVAGLETLLLLVREEPLPAGFKLKQVLGKVPAGHRARLRNPREAVLLGQERGMPKPTTLLSLNRGTVAQAREVDEPLAEVLDRLRETFVVQWAARFAHVAE
jgi:hypothetical protein